jgi:hypothetical protein
MKSSIFWDITPYSPLKVNQRFGGTCRLHLQDRRISLARNYREIRWQAELLFFARVGTFLRLFLEPICSSETSVGFQRTTRRYIPEDINLNCNFSHTRMLKGKDIHLKHLETKY